MKILRNPAGSEHIPFRGLALAVALACLPAANALAECASGSKTVFSCMTAAGKRIEVCDTKKTISYSFGKPGATPELALNVPREKASTFQWAGVGRYLSYTVEIPNGNTVYTVFSGMDRLDEKHPIEAGVNVTIKQQHAATVQCLEKGLVNNIEGIDLKPVK